MLVGIPIEEKTLEALVCPSFGRSPIYAVYNTESGAVEYKDNEAATSPGGAGIKAAQFLVDLKVHAVLTPRCGQNAADVLNAAEIKIYQSVDKSVKENLDLLSQDALKVLGQFHAGFHGVH